MKLIFTVLASLVLSQSQLVIDSSLAPSANALTNDDYVRLQKTISDFIAQNPKILVPKLIRAAFHDVQDYNPKDKNSASHGCLMQKRFLDASINSLIKNEVIALGQWVKQKLPSKSYPFGDVFAMAGKVAAEWDLPCIKINYRYGRSPCTNKDQLDRTIPTEFTGNITDINRFTAKLGLTTNELAVLIAGAHGTAFAKTTHWGFNFATTTSGKDYIARNLNPKNWKVEAEWLKYQGKSSDTIGRFEIDMVFYPSTITEIKKDSPGGIFAADPDAKPIERYISQFAKKPESAFNNEYAKAFAKMLEIGTDSSKLKQYNEPKTSRCPYPV